jgi:hypothetical protein
MNFFQGICAHKTDEARLSAVYNIPCFHQLYGKKDNTASSNATTRDTSNDEESKEDDVESPFAFDFTQAYC